MPWLTETSDEISWDRLGQLMAETVAQARRRICARPRRVLLLTPDITRAHSGAGRLTEMIYHELAGEAFVMMAGVNVGEVGVQASQVFFPTPVSASGTLSQNGQTLDFTLKLVGGRLDDVEIGFTLTAP